VGFIQEQRSGTKVYGKKYPLKSKKIVINFQLINIDKLKIGWPIRPKELIVVDL